MSHLRYLTVQFPKSIWKFNIHRERGDAFLVSFSSQLGVTLFFIVEIRTQNMTNSFMYIFEKRWLKLFQDKMIIKNCIYLNAKQGRGHLMTEIKTIRKKNKRLRCLYLSEKLSLRDEKGNLQLHLKYSQRFSPTFLINNKNAYQVLIRSCQSLKYLKFYIELEIV